VNKVKGSQVQILSARPGEGPFTQVDGPFSCPLEGVPNKIKVARPRIFPARELILALFFGDLEAVGGRVQAGQNPCSAVAHGAG
jgi:hypothetical protein